ncbi:MAG: response regulator [Deltaproteobacteria bacterium]|nr:MAG: response regulator [Deltaproteobacteria bacterium]
MSTSFQFGDVDTMAVPILVVDDEQNFLELLIRILGKRGFEVKTALSGTEALRLLEQDSFDLALLDIRMGPINGIQLLEEIKGRKPRIKAIMMTAYPTIETRMQAFEKGASAYLTKPVDLKELVDTMNSLVTH